MTLSELHVSFFTSLQKPLVPSVSLRIRHASHMQLWHYTVHPERNRQGSYPGSGPYLLGSGEK